MKKIIEKFLKFASRLILLKYRPKIIAITGSVGKTSTKDILYTVLQEHFRTRASLKNYNNEIGLPLTIIGHLSPNRSFVGWGGIFFAISKLLIWRDSKYPKYLILEMGADRPGDIAYLTSIAKPDMAVITFIGESHLEYFSTIENIVKEKFSLVDRLKKDAPIFLNIDNEYIAKELPKLKDRRVISYGFNKEAAIRASKDKLVFDQVNRYRPLGMEFDCSYQGKSERIFLPGVISRAQIYSALVAVGVGKELGINLNEIREILKEHHLPPGRMKILPGIKKTFLIDDSYNASPASAAAAFLSVSRLPVKLGSYRWAVLGDMLELGKESKLSHEQVGGKLVVCKFDYLITVGLRARDIAKGALAAGLSKDNIFSFDDTMTAGKFLEDRIKIGDLILIKGSQGARMEKIVKEVMANPLRSRDILVRQDASWG